MKSRIPNILTLGRLVLTLVMFLCLAFMPVALLNPGRLPEPDLLGWIAFVTFSVAAITDFFDGWLARKWGVVSTFGAILDPIADKVLVCGAILGLLPLMIFGPVVLIASGVILFREFSVSALREVLAPKGLKLPVTFLAKIKTTLQLVALAALIAFSAWVMGPSATDTVMVSQLQFVAVALYAVAALVTVWTGVEYALSAKKALAEKA